MIHVNIFFLNKLKFILIQKKPERLKNKKIKFTYKN